MALPGAHLSKKARKQLKSEPYKPLAPSYENKGQVAAKARQIAAGKVKPEVSDLTQEGKEARRQDRGRRTQIQTDYGGAEAGIKAAIANAQSAYDNYITVSNGGNTLALGNLTAALGSTHAADLQQASEVGGVLPTDNTAPNLTLATAANLAQTGNAQQQGAIGLGPVESMGPAAAVGKVGALTGEANKFKTLLDAIHEKRTAAKAKIGPAIAEAEKEINAEELAKASERQRENIARGQLENEGKSVGVSEEEAATNKYNAQTARTQADTASAQALKELKLKARELGVSKQIEWAKIHNEQKQLEAAVSEAGNGAEKEAAEAVAAKHSSVVEAMLNYVGNTKPKLQQPRTLLNILMGLTTNKSEALEIMLHSGVPQMIKFAKTYLGLNKTPKQGKVGSSHR